MQLSEMFAQIIEVGALPFGVGTPSGKYWIRSCCDTELHPNVHPGKVSLIARRIRLLKKENRHRGLTAIDKVKPTTAHLLAVYAGKPVQGTMPKMLNYKGYVAYIWQGNSTQRGWLRNSDDARPPSGWTIFFRKFGIIVVGVPDLWRPLTSYPKSVPGQKQQRMDRKQCF